MHHLHSTHMGLEPMDSHTHTRRSTLEQMAQLLGLQDTPISSEYPQHFWHPLCKQKED